jgi:Trk-type K+ transport system membrane component
MGERGYHIMWTLYVFSLTIIGGAFIVTTEPFAWVDAWFTATSATVNGGLSVLSMDELSHGGIAILQFLMVLGSSCFMLLPLLLYRCYCLNRYRPLMKECLASDLLSPADHRVIREYQTLLRASWITALVVMFYIVFCIGLGFIVLVAALHLFPNEPALARRHFSYAQNALFLSISAFTNSGLAISEDGISYLSNNALALITMGVLILAGNTLMPVFLRRVLELLHWLCRHGIGFKREQKPEANKWAAAVAYALAHPRKISTHLFSSANTQYLWQMSLIINSCEYILFVARALSVNALQHMGSKPVIAGLGLFQILNTRHCGFSVFDLRELPQEILFVNVLLMFLQPVPYMGLLHTTR